jgi:hypothetical protein
LPPVAGDKFINPLPRQGGPRRGDLIGTISQVIFGERHRERTERIRFHNIDSDVEEGAVEIPDDIGPGDVEKLVASFEFGSTKIVGRQPDRLQIGPGRSVKNHDSARNGIQIRHQTTSLSGQQGSSN